MVLLATLLRLEVSDLAGGFVLLQDHLHTQGAGWLLLRQLLRQTWAGPRTVIVTDPLALQLLSGMTIPVIDISVSETSLSSLSSIPPGSLILMDSLELLSVLAGEKETQRLIQTWRTAGCCCICLISSGLDFAEYAANIKIRVTAWDGHKGSADCIHLRGYTKVTREQCSLVLEQDSLQAAVEKPKPVAPPPMPVAPAPRSLIIVEDEDLESPDEEGDEDDLI